MVESLNELGEIIETVGGTTINHSYWDCECERDFIYHVSKKKCEKCFAEVEYQPNSREDEIDSLGKRQTKPI